MANVVVEPPPGSPNIGHQRREMRWWLKKNPHAHIFHSVQNMQRSHEERVQDLSTWLTIYLDRPDADIDWERVGLIHRTRRHRLNVSANGLRTVHSQVSTNRPRAWIVTSGGDYELQTRAKNKTKYLEGEFERLGVYELTGQALEDALWAGDGFVHVYDDGNRPAIEVVWPGEIMVDDRERKWGGGKTRTLYRRKAVDKEVLEEMYPAKKDAIRRSKLYDDRSGRETSGHFSTAEQALVIEAWHLPVSLPDGSKVHGKHVICVDTGTLFEEEWEEEVFPIARIPYVRHPRDYFAIGLIEFMSGSQTEIDDITEKIADSFRFAAPRVWVETNSNVNVQKIGNTPFEIHEYSGQPPIETGGRAIDAGWMQYLEHLGEKAYAINGISSYSAESVKPAGLNSGRAQLVHQEIESKGQISLFRNWEALHVEVAKLILMVTRRIAQDEERAPVLKSMVGDKELEELEWAKVDLGDNPYRVRVFPVSSLSKSPAGRLEQVQQMIDMQILTDPDEIRELLDYPDLENYNRIQSAQREAVEKLVDRALDGKKAEAFGELDLAYARKWGTLRLCLAELQRAPEGGIARLRDFLAHVGVLEGQAKAAMQAEMMAMQPPVAPGMGPPAPPSAAPPPAGPGLVAGAIGPAE